MSGSHRKTYVALTRFRPDESLLASRRKASVAGLVLKSSMPNLLRMEEAPIFQALKAVESTSRKSRY